MQLVINTLGASLRKQGDRFLIKAGDKELAVSAHNTHSGPGKGKSNPAHFSISVG